MRKGLLPIYRLQSPRNLPGFDGEGAGAGAAGAAGSGITIEQVNDAVNKTVNSAIANLRKNDFPKIVQTAIGEAMSPITLQLGTITEGLASLTGSSGSGGSGAGNGQSSGSGQGTQNTSPEVNAQLKTLTDQLKKQGDTITNLQADRDNANKRAETAEKTSVIKGALGDLQFANASALNTAFTIIEPMIKKNGDSFVGGANGDELPISDFIKDFIPNQHGYLLKSTGGSGSGAAGSSTAGAAGVASGRNVDISVIKPGMKPEDRAAALAAIAAAMPSQH